MMIQLIKKILIKYRIKINVHELEMDQNSQYFGQFSYVFYLVKYLLNIGVDFGLLMSCNYKSLAKFKMDDKFLTIMGAFGALACGLSRFLWTNLL